MAKETKARRTSVSTGEITRAPSQQSKLVPRQVPEFKSSAAGLEGLNQAFANFFGQVNRAADNVGDAIAFAEKQRILRENEAEKATAVGDALSGRPMSAEGERDYDYYDTYRAVLAEKTGVEASREFKDWYRSDFLANNPDGDLSDARQKWAEQHLGGSDDPEFQGMSLGTFYKSTEEMIGQHREARTKALFAKGSDNVQAVIDNDVEMGQLTPERLTGHVDTMRKLDPLNAAEAAPRVAAQLGVAIQNHPEQSEAVLATLSKPGSGINGKSFQDSFPEAYAKLQESAVRSFKETNTFAEMKAIDELEERARHFETMSVEEMVKFHRDLTNVRQTYGAGNAVDTLQNRADAAEDAAAKALARQAAKDAKFFEKQGAAVERMGIKGVAALERAFEKEAERRATEYANLSQVRSILVGETGMDVDVFRKNLPNYLKTQFGVENVIQGDANTVATVLAKSNGVVVEDHKKQFSGALVSAENPQLQAKAFNTLYALEKARNRDYVKQWLDEPAERLYTQVSDEMDLTGESADAAILRANERRRNGKPFDSWVSVMPDSSSTEANQHVREQIVKNVTEDFSNRGLLGSGFWQNSVVIPPDVYDRIEKYAKNVVIERGTQGVDVDKSIAEAVKRTVGRGEVLPQNGKYVLSFDSNRSDMYVDNGKAVPRVRLGFNERNPRTGEMVDTIGVYQRHLGQLGSSLPQLLRNGSTDDVSLTDHPLSAGSGSFSVSQNGTPIVFEIGQTFEMSRSFASVKSLQAGGTKIEFSDDPAKLNAQLKDYLPQGFGFVKVPIGIDKFGWMLSYRANFGDEEGISLEQREKDFKQPTAPIPNVPTQPMVNPKVWQNALPK